MKPRSVHPLILIALLVLFSQFCIAQDEYYTASEMRIRLNIVTRLEMHYEPGSDITQLSANLSLFPKEDYRQEVIEIETNNAEPEYRDLVGQAFDIHRDVEEQDENIIRFNLDDPQLGDVDLNLSYEIITTNTPVKVTKKIDFPIYSLDPDIIEYIYPTDKIDSDNPNIVTLANFIAEGEDDLFKLVSKLASWVKYNIHYNLTTMTADASINASWVIENRYGVCDELTNAFIALNRALGIPARFVSGISFSNIDEGKWGTHGWAEVYFPEFGWVPFDVTYGQFGSIDASHIKLKDSTNSDTTSVTFEWIGRDINISILPLEFDTEVQEITQEDKLPDLSMTAVPFADAIGENSYDIIDVQVKNQKNYYIAKELQISNTEGMDIIDSKHKPMVLMPNEEKTIYWIVQFVRPIEKNYIVTVPVLVYTNDGIDAQTSFEVQNGKALYDYNEIKTILDSKKVEEVKTYSKEIDIQCIPDKQAIYDYETINISCSIKNTGNVFFRDLSLCYQQNCHSFDLGISQTEKRQFEFSSKDIGVNALTFKTNSKDTNKDEYVDILVKDIPQIEISHLSNPNNVDYNSQFDINFTLEKISESLPTELVLEISSKNKAIHKTFSVNSIESRQDFNIKAYGKDLSLKDNDITITAYWRDDNWKSYYDEEIFTVTLDNPPFFKRIIIKSRDFFKCVEGLFTLASTKK